MARIAIFQLGYETNTFAEGFAEVADMGSGGFFPGSEVISTFAGKRAGISGILAALADKGATPVPMDMITRGGAYNAGPTLSRHCVETVLDHICAELAERADEYDGLCLAMHGAGFAEGYEDADSYYLRRIREVVGAKPITACLDLHGNISEEMISLADVYIGIKENPHTDFFEAGYLAAATLVDKLEGRCDPKMSLRRIPMLVPTANGSTLDGAGLAIKEYIRQYKEEHGLIDVAFFHSFPATDSRFTSCSVIAVADGYAPEKVAAEIAMHIWEMRHDFATDIYDAAQAIDAALTKVKDGYVVINEGTDNPGAGGPGAGTHLLREMIARDLPRSIMGPMKDPEAAAECHRHSVGDRFHLELGGHTQAIYGEPLPLEVELLALCDGDFVCASPVHRGVTMHYGPSARVRCGNVEIIVVTNRFQTYDDRPFIMTGADMKDYSIVALKSSNHFRAYFRSTADAIVGASTPSAFPSDMSLLPFERLPRPIYPLDENVEYTGIWP